MFPKRYNTYTRGLLWALALLVFGVVLNLGRFLAFEAHHPGTPVRLQPISHLARHDLQQIKLLPRHLGTLSSAEGAKPSIASAYALGPAYRLGHGKIRLTDYHHSTRWERPLSGQMNLTGEAGTCRRAVSGPWLGWRHLGSDLIRICVSWLDSGLPGTARFPVMPVEPISLPNPAY